MNDVVYSVQGGLEDWAYGNSWESKITSNNVNKTCQIRNPIES